MSRTVATALPVWASVAVALLIVALVLPIVQWWPALPVVAAAAVLLAFLLQVSLQTKEGLVGRMLVSVSGIVLIVAVASGLMLIIAGVG